MSKSINPLDYSTSLIRSRRYMPSGWITHVPFGMFIVDLLRPRTFVELGTFYGVSYCAFCEAVKELKLKTQCYAIDTWEGDPQGGYYGKEVLTDLRKYHDKYYKEFSQLIRSTFDEASVNFKNSSIDILHIDGYHTLEVVNHDFQTWLPKMSDRGVILFHDICEYSGDFGVWKLWDELKGSYPSFEFSHGHGLGLLAVGTNYPKSLKMILNASHTEKTKIQNYFREMGEREKQAQELTMQVQELTMQVQELTMQVQELTMQAQELKTHVTACEQQIFVKEQIVQKLTTQNNTKDLKIASLSEHILEMRQSRSWRWTAPLRKLFEIFRRRKTPKRN